MNQNIPIIAFFGAKGGVGKTTVTNKFADLVASAGKNPKVLIIDFDVSARGTTIFRTKGNPFHCKTLHDYIATRSAVIEDAIDVTETMEIRSKSHVNREGLIYLIPSATPDARETFRAIALIEPDELLNILRTLIDSAIKKYNINCVLIDCGPTLNDPYTAAAAHIADQAFIIAQNEPTSQEALKNYTSKIKEFYPDFSIIKMRIVLNKVRAVVPESMGFFSVIPFTIDIVDISEGIKDIDEVRLTLLDHYIFDIVKRSFAKTHPQLIPDAKIILPEGWRKLMENASELANSFRIKFYKLAKKLLFPLGIGLTLCILALKIIFSIDKVFDLFSIYYLFIPSIILLGVGVWGWQHYKEPKFYLDNLIEKKEEFLFIELRKRSGRRVLEGIKSWLK